MDAGKRGSAPGEPGALRRVDEVGLRCQLVADVLEDLAHDRAQEEQGDDHDDRDEGEKQTVLNESLAFLVLALETSQKSADEFLIMCLGPPFLKICCRSVRCAPGNEHGRMVLPPSAARAYLAPERRSCQVPP